MNQTYFIILEYFSGVGLNTFLSQNKVRSIPQIIDIISCICHGLDHIHKKHIIHRDLKPGHVLVQEHNGAYDYSNLKIIDFGLCQIKEGYTSGPG